MSISRMVWVIALVAAAKACDPADCPRQPTKFYLELGCSPITDGESCCPTSFNCSHLKSRIPGNCYLKHEMFEAKKEVSQELIQNSCIPSCVCVESGSFVCTHAECEEYYGSQADANCTAQYTAGVCCVTNTVCGEDEIAELATCEVDGKTFKEGEQMHSEKDPCKSCVCGKGFTGKLEEPFCKPDFCEVELFNPEKLRAGCIPIYSDPDACCERHWRCPQPEDSVIVSTKNIDDTTNDTAMTCKFGELTMKKGDVLSKDEESCVVCSCHIPPFAFCMADAECEKKEIAELLKLNGTITSER